MRVLMVCLGNICRSPAAEAVLQSYAPDWKVDSAGTSDWHIGQAPDERAIAEGHKRGYDLSPLSARQFFAADFDIFDVIYAMDKKNLRAIEALRPRDNTTRVELFLGDADVPDPYYDNSFERMFDLIEARVQEIAQSELTNST